MTEAVGTTRKGGAGLGKFLEAYGIILVVVVMMLVLAAIKPEVFLTAQNLTNIIKQNASLALLALGMYVVIVTAGIDLSVGSIMALGMVALAIASKAGVPWQLVILIGPAIGLVVGWVNGVGLTVLKLPHPFIMTLGTLNVARGLTYLISNGAPVSGCSRRCGSSGRRIGTLGSFRRRPVFRLALLSSRCARWRCGSFSNAPTWDGTSLPSAAIRMRRAFRVSMSIARWSWST